MTDFSELRAALQARLDVVADHELRDRDAAGHLEKLKGAARRLDEVVAGLPKDVHPQLRHFLERQSFLKAIAWIDGEKSCDHKHH
jgi:hypothetical protein